MVAKTVARAHMDEATSSAVTNQEEGRIERWTSRGPREDEKADAGKHRVRRVHRNRIEIRRDSVLKGIRKGFRRWRRQEGRGPVARAGGRCARHRGWRGANQGREAAPVRWPPAPRARTRAMW